MLSTVFYHVILPIALAVLFFANNAHSGPLEPRQTMDCSPGGVTQPAADTSISGGDAIPFTFVEGFRNQCHPPFTPISVWLLASQPTLSSLNATHEFDEFLFYFGDFMIDNIPSALPQMGTPPPSTLNVPDIGVEFKGRDVYIAVVQTAFDCPPEGHTAWCLSSNVLHYITN